MNPSLKQITFVCFLFFAALGIQAETYWATTVVSYYGTNAASSINNILGVNDQLTTDVGTADGATWNNYLTVSFGRTFYEMAGGKEVAVYLYDLDVVEDFYVYVSANNTNWYQIGFVSTTTESLYPTGTFLYFDMAGCGITAANYVKIVTNESDAAYSAPDLDAIAIIIPEPSTLLLLCVSFLGFFLKRK